MQSRIRWRGLRSKIIAWSFGPTMIILVAVAVVIFYAYQDVTEELVTERNQELTRLTAGQFTAELKEYADLLDAEARAWDIYGNDPVAQRQALKAASNRLVVFDAGVLVLDTFGTVVATEPGRPEIMGKNWSDRSYYRQMILSQTVGTPVFSDIATDGPGGTEVVVVAMPITGLEGEFVGTIAGMFHVGARAVSSFYGGIAKLRIGNGGSAYIIDSSGRVIYHSDAERIGDDFSAQPVVQTVLSGKVGAVRTYDLEGREIVASFAPVPGTSWGLVTQERWASLIGSSQAYQQFLLLLLALGVIVPVLVVTFGVRRITKPIGTLIDAAQEVARGNFGHTITAHTGDEIEELASQFNLMSAQLKESYATLEQRVADRTKELAAVNAIASVVSSSLDLDKILKDALEKTLEVTGIEAGGIYLLREGASPRDERVLNVVAYKGVGPQFVADIDNLKVGEGFSGHVAQTGEPLVVRDLSTDSRLTRSAVTESGFRSVAIVPLASREKVWGTLFVVTRDYREFSEQDIELLTSIGDQIGVAIENARLFDGEQRRAEQFRVISEVGRRITSVLDVDELLDEIVHLLKETFGYYQVTIGLIEGDELVFNAGVKTGWHEAPFTPQPVKVHGKGITAWVAARGEPLLAPDVSKEPRYLLLPEWSEIRSELAVPLKTKSGVIGVLDVESDQLNAFDDSDLAVLQALAQQAAIAIENARLYEESQRTAVREERSRLARDLHDAVTQALFSASLIAEVVPTLWESDQEEGRELLKELRQLTRGALAEMRTLLLELRPAALAEASLEELLRELCEALTGRTGVPVTVTVEGYCDLPSDVHLSFYRIAQEALNNVVKHSQANQVTVSLRCISSSADGIGEEQLDRVELLVSDDGRGFDPSSVPPDRLGLGIIRERAQAVGATVKIESEPGHGTQVIVVWAG